jgi:hypothetical protein
MMIGRVSVHEGIREAEALRGHCEEAEGRRSNRDPQTHTHLDRDCFGVLRTPRNDVDGSGRIYRIIPDRRNEEIIAESSRCW